MTGRRRVLVVEDDPTERDLITRAIRSCELPCEVDVAPDGREACDYLEQNGHDLRLVLLDLHLPFIGGLEVLERMRASEMHRRIPVVVVSTSDDPQDIRKSYELCANSYVQKTFDVEVYLARLKVLLYYWTSINLASN